MPHTHTDSLLLIEDSPSLARVYQEYLRGEPITVEHVETGKAALAIIDERPPECILLDLKLPDMNGLEILRHIHDQGLSPTVIIITAHGSVDVAVEAMRIGAFDFLEKPFSADRLLITVRNALERRRLERVVEIYKEGFERDRFEGFIGASLPMQAVYRIIDSAAPSRASVFITGESGTGKEVCAEAIHRLSPRRDGPFVAINCAAIPRDLMESEIFGHIKGAFTGAYNARDGAATRADGGTLFLDEVAEMDMDLQAKLLRFLQTGTFQKVGGSRMETVDVRIISATNKDPLELVRIGRLREDLYYRLHVIPIHMPPLRERDDDVLLIGREFLQQFAREEGKHFKRFDHDAELLLLQYDWPGNVRELQNVIRNVVVLYDQEVVSADMLPHPLNGLSMPQTQIRGQSTASEEPPAEEEQPTPAIRPLWQVEKDAIEAAIDHCNGNIPKAAAMLEISASTIYRKRQSWEAEGKL
jgi:two-component system repressor protein LuxO